MAEVRFVDGNIGADDSAHGTSALSPWRTIGWSLTELSKLAPGDKILWVCSAPPQGYTENLTMKGPKFNDISIRGADANGNPPTITKPAGDYDWAAFCEGRPPIDGSGRGSVFHIEDVTGVVLQDLNIRNGKADLGAGVHAINSQVDLIRCCVHDNEATGDGGGFAFDQPNQGGKKSKIDGCVIFNNKATKGGKDGGGGWLRRNAGPITITKTLVHDNTADEHGGGLALADCKDVSILQHCVFGGNGHKNTAKEGGAMYISSNTGPITIGDPNATAAADKNKIEENVASVAGGGIRILTGSVSVIVGGTDIKRNKADSTGAKRADGGAIAIQQFGLSDRPKAQARVDRRLQLQANTVIEDNHADRYGGGIFATIGTEIKISDNVAIRGNKAQNGAGIYASVCSGVTAGESDVTDNKADEVGGGIYAANSSVDLTGTTLDGNGARDGGGAYVETRLPLGPDERDFIAAVKPSPAAVGSVQINAGGTGGGTMTKNGASAGGGGGLECRGDIAGFYSLDVAVHGVSVGQNKAQSGGGVHAINVRTVTIDGNCSFFGNTASLEGGGVSVHHVTSLSIVNNTQGFVDNKAVTGAGIYVSKCEVSAGTVRDNTFSGNTLTGARGVGRDGVFDSCTFNPASLDLASIETANMPAGAAQPSFIKK